MNALSPYKSSITLTVPFDPDAVGLTAAFSFFETFDSDSLDLLDSIRRRLPNEDT